MNVNRIKELQEFANEFNKQLKDSEESNEIKINKLNIFYTNKRIKKSNSTVAPDKQNETNISNYNIRLLYKNQKNQKSKRSVKSCKKKQGKLNNNIYKSLLPWIPPHYIGNYFDNFKILKDRHNLSAWEKVIKLNIFIFIE